MAPIRVTVFLALLCSSVPSFAQTNISGIDFNCPPLEKSAVPPTSVHSLRPSDIAVIGALGDSLTAGFGIQSDLQSIFTNPIDYRGLSWSIGGDASLPYVTTLPNILRQYNSDLYGFSNGTTPISDFVDLQNTRLNIARSGASTPEMLQQAQDLVRKIRESDSVDFNNDWKLVTMYIGSNDICKDFCTSADIGPETWLQNVSNSLDYLQENLPRTFVNLVQIPHLTAYHKKLVNSSLEPVCRSSLFSAGCPCGLFGNLSIGDDEFEQLLVDYRQGLANLVNMYENSDTFTVVFQPYQTEVEFKEDDDIVLFSAADCLHLSPMGNKQTAIGLWNNMLERVGEKTSSIVVPIANFKCPTEEQPFLFTAQNSQAEFSSAAGRNLSFLLLIAAAFVSMATVAN